ncbi:amino acid adenylation domain-containing protein [Streptomyces sp. NPDC058001]|uniref:amino acid adenylation domain-containing protein n=1 Tax=Streptomyces sp. NPDC058001 TaxID=3346300 RepID=UPI0036E57E1F
MAIEDIAVTDIVDQFERSVDSGPDEPAVVHGDLIVSYRELDCRANRLAHALIAAGVGAESVVATVLEPSVDLLVAHLAVLKSGGAFLPVDPTQPANRLADLVYRADARAVIVPDDGAGFPLGDVTAVPMSAATHGDAEAVRPRSAVHPEQLAYVIYTSGSTGRPKAVGVSRYALSQHAVTITDRYELSAADRVLLAARPGVDVAIEQSLPPLTRGASVLVPAGRWGALELVEKIREARPTVVDLLPGYAQHLSESDADGAMDSVRLLLLGGDTVKPTDIRAWRRILPASTRIMNAYGPTEATVTSVVGVVGSGVGGGGVVPIGVPVGGVRVFVVDEELRLVPVGVPGELLIGGVGVARGYVGQAGVTAECFVPDLFGGSGGRLYRSGDRCVWRGDGVLEFVGRVDGQVKVRGFRVEPGEVEAVVVGHVGVAECLVMVREDRPGDRRLVAYVRPVSDGGGGGGSVSPVELRGLVQGSLPEYMVPAAFVLVSRFPLTVNGKVDRSALPVPGREDLAVSEGVEPVSGVERAVAEVWRRVLGVDRVGLHDNFFALGGDSIAATRVISRLRRERGVELPMSSIFEAPLLEEFAARVGGESSGKTLAVADVHNEDGQLSFAQQRLWFLDQYEPENGQYNVSLSFRIRGDLHEDVLKTAFRTVLERHDVLRTGFGRKQGRPVLHVLDRADVSWEPVDLRWLGKVPTREQEAKRRVREFMLRPFDLGKPPLLRVLTVRLSAAEWIVTITQHHIVTDWWSLGQLLDELSAAYAARLNGRSPELPKPVIQYADYAAWQQQWLAGEELDRQLGYWRTRLAGYEPAEILPNRPRPPVRSTRGVSHDFQMDPAFLADLKGLAQQFGATLHMVLMSAVALLLARYTGRSDVAFGTAASGRNRSELESLLGFFVNTLVIRLSVDKDMTFADLLRTTREVSLSAYDHADLPFDKLVEDLSIDRDPSRTPLFQLMCVLENPAQPTPDLEDLQVEEYDVPVEIAPFDLTVEFVETARGLRGRILYAKDLFDERMIAQLAAGVQTGLAAMAADPERPLAEVSVLSEEHRRQLLTWGTAEHSHDGDEFVLRRFERQVEARPEATAVVCEEDSLSYRELNERANRLAHHLRRRGIQPADVVGVGLRRSPELVVGMLAVFKAGAAYLPLDPELPADRVAVMLSDAEASLVVTDDESGLVAIGDVPTVWLDDVWADDSLPMTDPAQVGHSEDLAYTVFTSGSTGRPKGVMVSQRSLDGHTAAMEEVYAFKPDDRVLHFLAQGFDVSLEQVFTTLACGATLVLRGDDRWSPLDLVRRVDYHGITVLHLTPSHWQGLVGLLESSPELRPDHIGLVIVGGEQMTRTDADRSQAVFPAARHLNVYGPTEATVTSVVGVVGSGVGGGGVVPIGVPVGGVRVFVVDEELRLVPVGVPGELLIGGVGVARGYVGQAGVTAECFVPDLFGGSGGRLYRSGDRCVWRGDGVLEFVGRVDGQVKVRGFRVEPGEVEAVVVGHVGVAECLVMVREDRPGDRRLVAYVRPVSDGGGGGGSVSPVELRGLVQGSLPEYMVPAAFVLVSRFPLTVNGKVDRSALPVPGREDLAVSEGVEPVSGVERAVAEVWRRVLGVDRVGLHDNFFALGGQSLLATEAVARLNDTFGVDLSLPMIFQEPTVAALAAMIEEKKAGPADASALPELVATGASEAPLSYDQEGMWLLEQWHPGTAVHNVPIGVRLSGRLDPVRLEHAVQAVVARHGTLRTVFPKADPPVQLVLSEAAVPLRIVDLTDHPAATREGEARVSAGRDAGRPFDLEQGPPLRATLYVLGPTDHLLLLTVHHLVSDGFSLGLLVEEVGALYGGDRAVPELPVQYTDHATWQRRWLTPERMSEQHAYWKRQLAGVPTELRLPTDRPRPSAQTFTGGCVAFRIGEETTRKLEELANREGATLFMAVLAGYALALHRRTGQDDLLIGTPIASRTRTELRSLIGSFVNTLVIRSRKSADMTLVDFLRATRDTVLGAVAHQDVPFEWLIDAARAARDSTRPPLVQAWLDFINLADAKPALKGLEAEYTEVFDWPVHYEIQFDLWPEHGGLAGEILYKTDLFDPGTVREIAVEFETILDAVAAKSATVGELMGIVDDALVEHRSSRSAELENVGRAKLDRLLARRAAGSVTGGTP